jgi:hypothetical protein
LSTLVQVKSSMSISNKRHAVAGVPLLLHTAS